MDLNKNFIMRDFLIVNGAIIRDHAPTKTGSRLRHLHKFHKIKYSNDKSFDYSLFWVLGEAPYCF